MAINIMQQVMRGETTAIKPMLPPLPHKAASRCEGQRKENDNRRHHDNQRAGGHIRIDGADDRAHCASECAK
jgi:hypothetical protein